MATYSYKGFRLKISSRKDSRRWTAWAEVPGKSTGLLGINGRRLAEMKNLQ